MQNDSWGRLGAAALRGHLKGLISQVLKNQQMEVRFLTVRKGKYKHEKSWNVYCGCGLELVNLGIGVNLKRGRETWI